MLTANRSKIFTYEQAFGTDPDGPNPGAVSFKTALGQAILKAQRAYPDPAMQALAVPQSLTQEFNSEADAIINDLNGTYGSILPEIVNASEGAGGLTESVERAVGEIEREARENEEGVAVAAP